MVLPYEKETTIWINRATEVSNFLCNLVEKLKITSLCYFLINIPNSNILKKNFLSINLKN